MLSSNLAHEQVGHTQQHTSTITSFSFASTCTSVSKMIKNMGGINHCLMRWCARELRNKSHATGVLLESRVVKPLLWRLIIEMHGHFRKR